MITRYEFVNYITANDFQLNASCVVNEVYDSSEFLLFEVLWLKPIEFIFVWSQVHFREKRTMSESRIIENNRIEAFFRLG